MYHSYMTGSAVFSSPIPWQAGHFTAFPVASHQYLIGEGGNKGQMYFCDPSESMQYRVMVLVACVSLHLMVTDKMESSEHL